MSTVLLKHPSNPEVIAQMKKAGQPVLAVTTTRYFILHGGTEGRKIEDIVKEWFVKYNGSSHAYRDGSHVGGADEVSEVKVLTEEGRVINVAKL